MSLQLIAKQMEAKGRNGDSVLVHMTHGEVAGLQKLAESAGGSLSVNPETGLVEANFLKRMLPTLVGLGVGAATMNPYAGAAAGAAVGGYQARRNDQDVLLGAAMGGLGGYGGASMAGGLTSAGAGAAQQAAMTAAPQGIAAQNLAAAEASKQFVAQPALTQMGQGISALGTEAGRGAFMSQVGGGAGLMSDVGMATAPMMAPGKAPGPAPVDDEMYSYTYNPGRTGAERSPMATSAERKYFDGGFSPMRKIRANQYGMAAGGLLSLAEGGSTTAPSGTSSEGMTGASKAAFEYLMGRADTSGFEGQGVGRGIGGGGGGFRGDDHMYIFDPATGLYTRNPNYEDPEVKAARLAAEAAARAAAARAAQEASDREEANRRAEEEARRRALAIQAPPARSIIARNPAVIVGGPISRPNIQGTPLGEPGGGGGGGGGSDVIVGGPIDLSLPQGYDLDTGAPYSVGGGGGGGIDYGGYSPTSDDASYGGFFAEGGILGLAKGGMASGGFVVPADVVSALGNGSTDAGLRKLYAMLGKVKPIKGKGDGLSDSIPTHIDGKQRARVADGEAYIDPKTVKRLGGAKKLYAMMDKIRAQAHGKTSQQRKVNPAKVMA